MACAMAAMLAAGCGTAGRSAAATQPSWLHATLSFAPTPPVARQYETVELRLTDASGKPLEGARLAWNADMIGMDHPAPAGLVEGPDGTYSGRTLFVMGGAWLAKVQVTAGGHAATLSFPFEVRD